MNIAFLHYSFPGIGGTETVTRLLADYFKEAGHTIYVLAWKEGKIGAVPDSIDGVFTLPDSGDFNAKTNTDFIVDRVKDKQIDLIINQGPFWKIEPAVKDTDCKIVSVLHYAPTYRIDNNRNAIRHLWAHQAGSLVYFAKTAIRRAFINHFAVADFRKNDRELLRSMVKGSDAFLVLCDKYVDQLKEILGIDADNIYAINNPIEIGVGFERKTPACGGRKGVIFVGRLTKWDKRVDRLLRIWAKVYKQYPDWTLYIVGDGEEKQNLESLAKKLGLKNVVFTGFTDPTPYYCKSSIQCLTSSSEGFPMVILEAQKYGLTPIAFNSTFGIESLIGDSGVLVPPYSLKDYAEKLSLLMSDYTNQSRIDKSLENVNKYDKAAIGQQWLQLIQSLMNYTF